MAWTEMYQSSYDKPEIFLPDSHSEGIDTGLMGGCVSIIALAERNGDGHYKRMVGQHGAGGISNVNFITLCGEGRIYDDWTTQFLVIWTRGDNNVRWEIANIFKGMVKEGKIKDMNGAPIRTSQFKIYECTGFARVTRGNAVFDKGDSAREIQPICRYIAQFVDLLKGRNNEWVW